MTKTDWVNIRFEWDRENWRLKERDMNLELKVRNHTGQVVTVNQLSPRDARETLGVMQNIEGDEKPEVIKLCKK